MPYAGKRSGKESGISVGATDLTLADFTVTERVDDLDVTDYESGGAEEGIIGVSVIEGDLSGDWDADQNRFDDPPGLYCRDDLELRLYLSRPDNTFWDMPVARILSAGNTAPIRGKVGFRANFKSNGAATQPTG